MGHSKISLYLLIWQTESTQKRHMGRVNKLEAKAIFFDLYVKSKLMLGKLTSPSVFCCFICNGIIIVTFSEGSSES